MKGVVARHDAIGRARKANHALLVADVGRVVGVGESGAGFVFDEIAIEVQIVGGKDEGRRDIVTRTCGGRPYRRECQERVGRYRHPPGGAVPRY